MEDEVIRRLDSKCSESKRERQSFVNQAKKYASNKEMYNMYINKAEEVDLNFCKKYKDDLEILRRAEE